MPDQTEGASIFRKITIANELGGNEKFIVEFSDAGGNSGLSFGVTQMDISHFPNAILCLRECGFTEDEITGLKDKTIDYKSLEPKLKAHADIIARYDDQQLSWCLTHAQSILDQSDAEANDITAFMAIADMSNQFRLSTVDKCIQYLANLGRPFIAKDVLDFKLSSTPYGKSSPGDCRRRYMNILKVMQNG